MQRLKERMISGLGTFPVIGSYDDVAEIFQRLHEAGLDGIAIGMVNYIDEFPILRSEAADEAPRAPPSSRGFGPSRGETGMKTPTLPAARRFLEEVRALYAEDLESTALWSRIQDAHGAAAY